MGMSVKTYRRRRNSRVWHWMRKCSNWPTKKYVVIQTPGRRPWSGELCDQCLAKERRGQR